MALSEKTESVSRQIMEGLQTFTDPWNCKMPINYPAEPYICTPQQRGVFVVLLAVLRNLSFGFAADESVRNSLSFQPSKKCGQESSQRYSWPQPRLPAARGCLLASEQRQRQPRPSCARGGHQAARQTGQQRHTHTCPTRQTAPPPPTLGDSSTSAPREPPSRVCAGRAGPSPPRPAGRRSSPHLPPGKRRYAEHGREGPRLRPPGPARQQQPQHQPPHLARP